MKQFIVLWFLIAALFACKKDQSIVTIELPTERKSYLALGDSYTIGERVTEAERWPNQLTDSLDVRGIQFGRPLIIAKTGWRSDQLQAAIDTLNRKDWDLVTLLIGVNDYYQNWPVQAFVPKFAQLVDSAIALAAGNKEHVLVLSIPDYGYTPFGQSNQAIITAGLALYNQEIEVVCNEKNIQFINITDISQRGLQETDLVAPDGLHPSGRQYSLWVERLLNFSFFEQYR